MKGIIERFGGSWNGYTWMDQTTYLETASRDALDRMLFIEAERMADSLFDPEDCDSERTVIISELEGGENDPDQLLEIEVTAAAYKAHPYGHPTIGWLADLQRMTRDDLYGHYRRYYVPNNATLVVVGDVEADDVFRRAARQFGGIESAGVGTRVRTREPEQPGERRVTVSKDGTTAYVKLAYHAPAVGDEDFPAMLLVDAALSGAKGLNLWSSFRGAPPQRSARLYRALVDRRLASSVSGALLPTLDPFLYTISMTVADGAQPSSVEAASVEAIESLVSQGTTPAELAKVKSQLRARMVFEMDSVTNIAHQLGYFETIASAGALGDFWRRVEAVGADQVNDAARRYLAPSNRTVGRFEPKEAR